MTRYSIKLTKDRLSEVLDFNPSTGFFIWKKSRGRAIAGSVAGCVGENGYRWIGIDGQIYHSHRLVWLLTYGEWPTIDIDHRDRNGDNNRPSNLRLATNAENQWNTTAQKNNTSGHKGVFRHQNRWLVLIQKNGVRHYVGYFKDYAQACAAQESAASDLHLKFCPLTSHAD